MLSSGPIAMTAEGSSDNNGQTCASPKRPASRDEKATSASIIVGVKRSSRDRSESPTPPLKRMRPELLLTPSILSPSLRFPPAPHHIDHTLASYPKPLLSTEDMENRESTRGASNRGETVLREPTRSPSIGSDGSQHDADLDTHYLDVTGDGDNKGM